MNAATDFDLGPLTWVRGGIGLALEQAIEALSQFQEKGDTAQLKSCRTHLRQVHGALSMVGMDGVTRISEALETVLVALEDKKIAPATALPAIQNAITAVGQYLDALLVGEPNQPLRLMPVYQSLQALLGQPKANPADLFFPNLTLRPRKRSSGTSMNREAQIKLFHTERMRFQKGLLAWLKQPAGSAPARDGLAMMQDAVRSIEAVQSSPSVYAFWRSASGLVTSLVHGANKSGDARQICARIDLQIRRLMEGTSGVAERLWRDILFYVAQSSVAADPILSEIQDAYHLKELIPATGQIKTSSSTSQETVLRRLKESIVSAEEHWNRFCGGGTSSLLAFVDQTRVIAQSSAELGNDNLKLLTQILNAAAVWLSKQSAQQGENISMEIATTLILIQNAQQNFANLGADFSQQVRIMAVRLGTCMKGEKPSGDAPLIDEISRRAQERRLMVQVVREIQNNLTQSEQTLDAFFRDPVGITLDTKNLTMLLSQVVGALAILGHNDAVSHLQASINRIQAFAKKDAQPVASDFEWVAQQLSILGFFVEAIQYGEVDFNTYVGQLLRPGISEESSDEFEGASVASVETQLERLKAEIRRLLEAVKANPGDAKLRGELQARLQAMQKDADLVADQALVAQVRAALSSLKDESPLQNVAAALTPISAQPEVHAPSAKTLELAQSSEDELDAELLAIFLEEAEEVLATMGESLDILRQHPYDTDVLTTIRRSSHTLKGSGRMVGLKELGEVAWSIEQTFNLWLNQKQEATPEILDMIDLAHQVFGDWVGHLNKGDGIVPDYSKLVALAERLRGGETVTLASAQKAKSVDEGQAQGVAPVEKQKSATSPDDGFLAPPNLDLGAFAPAQFELTQKKSEQNIEDEPLPVTSADGLDSGEEAGQGFYASDEVSAIDGVPVAEDGFVAPAEDFLPSAEFVEPDEPQKVEPEEFDKEQPEEEALSWVKPEDWEGADFKAPPEDVPVFEPDAPLSNLSFEAVSEPGVEQNQEVFFTPEEPEPLALSEEPELPAILEEEPEPPAIQEELPEIQEEQPETVQEQQETTACPFPDISPQLFEIFKSESLSYMNTLQEFMEDLAMDVTIPTPFDATRAAHTLAGIAGTLGFTPLNTLSHTLELTLLRRDESQSPDCLEGQALLRQTVRMLEGMLAQLNAGQRPDPQPSLIEALSLLYPAKEEVPSDEPIPLGISDDSLPVDIRDVFSTAPETTPVASHPFTLAGIPISPESLPQDALDPDLLPIFLEESADLISNLYEQLDDWRQDKASEAAPNALARVLHTFKGSSRMAGAMRLGQLTHELESRVGKLVSNLLVNDNDLNGIEAVCDLLARVVECYQTGDFEQAAQALTPLSSAPAVSAPPVPVPSMPVAEPQKVSEPASPLTHFVREEIPVFQLPEETGKDEKLQPVPAVPAIPSIPDIPPVQAQMPVAPAPALKEPAKQPAAHEADSSQKAVLRVRAGLVDQLVNEAGELSIVRARIEGEMRELKDSLLTLTDNVIRLRRQLREIEIQAETQIQAGVGEETKADFDPLELDRFTRFQELTRMMAESVNDVSTVQQNLLKNLDDANAAIIAQARLNRNLQQSLMNVRMVPFDSQSDRLQRLIRQVSRELGKQAHLEIQGGQVELDRSVLEQVFSPLEHMLRNAIAHGLESNEQRLALGKPAVGQINISLAQEGNEIIMSLSDDGAGLNLDRIREKAVKSGLIAPDAQLDEARLIDFIFHSGFSTAAAVSQVAGRGVGMDVVKTGITALGGRIDVITNPGQGTTFRLYLPLTLAVTQTVLIRAHGHLYAIPSSMVEQVMEVQEKTLNEIRSKGEAIWQNHHYAFHYLPYLLGDQNAQLEHRPLYWILLLRSGSRRVSILVDEMFGNQEAVVKNVGPQMVRVVGITGATVLGDGRIALILNPVALATHHQPVAMASEQQLKAAVELVATPTPVDVRRQSVVMVVDDSLTVRKITQKLLLREGYQVELAKDGMDALEHLVDMVPDVILSDIEMPRMDGFDLVRHIRADERLAHVPIIMITSRTAEKHRNYAMEIGANHYLGKPYDEAELLGLLTQHTQNIRKH